PDRWTRGLPPRSRLVGSPQLQPRLTLEIALVPRQERPAMFQSRRRDDRIGKFHSAVATKTPGSFCGEVVDRHLFELRKHFAHLAFLRCVTGEELDPRDDRIRDAVSPAGQAPDSSY